MAAASPFNTDLPKAKALLAEAGLPNGFETSFSFDAGSAGILEPMSVLIQESLSQIGIKATLNKIAGANWRASFASRKLPFLTNLFSGWLDYPNYYFEMALGKTSIFNSGNYDNTAMMAMVREARFERDPAKYDEIVQEVHQDLIRRCREHPDLSAVGLCRHAEAHQRLLLLVPPVRSIIGRW